MDKKIPTNMIWYMAGILDGEGYFGIKKSRQAKECLVPIYHERISVGMDCKEIIDLFHGFFGGTRYCKKERGLNHWRWEVSDKRAAELCEFFKDYVIVKRKQLELILKLRESKNKKLKRVPSGRNKHSFIMDPKIVKERDDLYWKVRNLTGRKKI